MRYLKKINDILEKKKPSDWEDDDMYNRYDPNMGRGDDDDDEYNRDKYRSSDFEDDDLKNLNISKNPNAKIIGDEDLDEPLRSRFEDDDYPEEEEGSSGEVDGNKADVSQEEEEEDVYYNDEMENLCYLIRKLFKNNRVEADVDYSDSDIKVYIYLQKREKISTLLRSFEVAMKLRKDILPQYLPEVELFENKQGFPIMMFTFSYDDGDDGDDGDDEGVQSPTAIAKVIGSKPLSGKDDDYGPNAPF